MASSAEVGMTFLEGGDFLEPCRAVGGKRGGGRANQGSNQDAEKAISSRRGPRGPFCLFAEGTKG
jgi:hypothetical protein